MTTRWGDGFAQYPLLPLAPTPGAPRWSLKKNNLMVNSAHGILGWAVASHKPTEAKKGIFKS